EQQFARAARLVDPLVKRAAEVVQGPEVLEIRRLVEQPGARRARPAALLEVGLAVEVALEQRAVPALLAEVLGELPRRRDERGAVAFGESAVGPVVAV